MATLTAAPETQVPALPRTMGLRDLVLFNIVAVLSLRWVATAAAAGPSSVTLWILAALFFFIPQGLAVSHLAGRYPNEGGIYYWTKREFGEAHGFLCGWCYWVNNILYYPNLLMSTAVVGTYVIGRGGSGMENDWSYVLPATLGALWLAVGINIVGLQTGRWLQNVGARRHLHPGNPAGRARGVRRADASAGDADDARHAGPGPHRLVVAQPLGLDRLRVRGTGAVRRAGR